MIPFAICSGIIEWTDDMEPLEIRLLELAPDFCTFRLPLRFHLRIGQVRRIQFQFYQRGRRCTVIPGLFKLTERETERWWTVWEYRTEDVQFQRSAGILTEEYLGYIRARLSMGDEELSHYMTGIYPEDREDDFASCGEEQMRRFAETIAAGYRDETWRWIRSSEREIHICLALENHELMQRFLNEPFPVFCEWYRERDGLLMRSGSSVHRHPLADLPVTWVSVGNASCPLQGPSLSELQAVIRKALEERLRIIYTLAPVSEMRLADTQMYLSELHAWLEKNSRSLMLEVNDAGMLDWLERQNFNQFHLKNGSMTDKRVRDRRQVYLDPEAAEHPDRLPGETGETVTLPFYRMNTGTFCTLYAAVTTGDRGKSCRVADCPGYCRNFVFLYPRHLQMIGRYNSVYGADTETLCDGERLRKACSRGVRYVTLN